MSGNALQQQIIYSDIPTNLDIHPVTGDLSRVTNENAVIASIKGLILTAFYERVMRLNVGSEAAALLFEPLTPVTSIAIRDTVKLVIDNFEPRADLIEVFVSSDPDNNRYVVNVYFQIVNREEPVETTVYLSRVR